MSNNKKVICFCFYDYEKYRNRWVEYLVGLKINTKISKILFPDWSIRLYTRITNDNIRMYIDNFCIENNIENIIIPPNENPMIYRFTSFFDKNIDVCIIRDIDSILSIIDYNYVNEWLNTEKTVLIYKEHLQGTNDGMGGGIGIKPKKLNINVKFISYDSQDRGYDESELSRLLKNISTNDKMIVYTRMTYCGSYFILNDLDKNPTECIILWTNPYYYTNDGYPPEKYTKINSKKLIKYVKKYKIPKIFMKQHQNIEKLVQHRNEWIR